jgi:DNA-binding response OmpR family regulator
MRKILVIDDEVQITKMITEVLSDEGYEILEAFDWPSGQQILGLNDDIDLVICDYRLPGGTGLDLLRAIKRKKGQAPSFLFITGLLDFVQDDEAEIIGSLTKPLDFDHLIQLIATFFFTHRPSLEEPPQISF